MSDFLVSRIYGEDHVSKGIEVNLCHCENCSFSFYDKRLTDEDEGKLYADYREEKYQKDRERYDCWYTSKVNDALNNDKLALSEQRRVISKMVNSNIHTPIKNALDYGGNRGDTYCDDINIENKYVYDISGVDTVAGVKRIADFNEIKNYEFDFIMCNMTLEHIADPLSFTKNLYDIGTKGTCYYFEVPSENPFEADKFSLSKNIKLFFNPIYSKFRLVKHYFKLRKQPYMPMNEHVNFYTPKAMGTLLEMAGFKVIDIQENCEKTVLGDNIVLSALCKRES